MQKFKVSYDKEMDDLFIYNPGAKSRGSIELGELVLDYDAKKEVVGIQITNASFLLQEISEEKDRIMIKTTLADLKTCLVDINQKRMGLAIIKIFLFKKPITFSAPLLKEPSPALVYAR